MIGKTIVHYTITEKIGAGGMGEVFRAADSKLGRDVALKMLPAAFAQHPERMARFQREAQVLASLNHPNIGAIYGLEEHDGAHFLVLELIEGPTLFDRLAAGRLSQNSALDIARQIAEAVEFAHENGVVHRDLKPANVKVMEDGRVKVLDFGLAKALEDPVEAVASAGDLSNSPTMTHAASASPQSPLTSALTAANVILGTAAYMSPEQARGKPIDKRADIWAFGVMLWEMLTGQRLFDEETASDTLAAVLRKDPDWEALPPETPPRIRRLVRRCLERNPKERLRDIGDARLSIEDVLAGNLGDESGIHPASAPRAVPPVLLGVSVLAAVVAVAAAFVAGRFLADGGEAELPLRKFMHPVPDLTVDVRRGTTVAIAPDGTRIAYTSEGLLWVRDLDRVEARSLAGTESARRPFWSPDGEWLAYSAERKLWKVPVTGGEPTAICELSRDFNGAGNGVWRTDGEIIFTHGDGPLLTVSAQGGDPDTLLAADPETEDDFHDVAALPGDDGIVFVVHDQNGNWERIDALIDGVRSEVLRHEGQSIADPCWSPSGHLIYHREPANAGIWAVPFSPKERQVTGKPYLVVPDGNLPHVSADGTLVHSMGGGSSESELLLVNRDGSVEAVLGPPQQYEPMPDLSPDGGRVAFTLLGENDDVWILDIQRGIQTRLTVSPGRDQRPAWSPDGRRIYYQYQAGQRFENRELRMRAADGTGQAAILGNGVDPAVSPDGRFLLYTTPDSNFDLHSLPLGEDGLPAGDEVCFLATNAFDGWPQLSPGGDYLAYVSTESGQAQIYLKRFPGGEGKWQVTKEGGHWHRWSATGDELYFAKGRDIYAVSVQTTPTLQLGTPTVLFTREADTRSQSFGLPDGFDVTADGRFLVVRPTDTRETEGVRGFVVVQNWFAEFRSAER